MLLAPFCRFFVNLIKKSLTICLWGNHKNRYYRAGILLPDVSEHRKRLYGL